MNPLLLSNPAYSLYYRIESSAASFTGSLVLKIVETFKTHQCIIPVEIMFSDATALCIDCPLDVMAYFSSN